MRTIIVTGGIGAGKSLACNILEANGIPVYDCDSKAKTLYGSHPELKKLLVPGIFDRPDKLRELEDALFPVLMDDFRKWANGRQTVAMESATILGKKYFDGFGDVVLFVDAPLETRLRRIESRDGGKLSREEAMKRIRLQKDCKDSNRTIRVIDNSSDRNHLEKQIIDFIKTLK